VTCQFALDDGAYVLGALAPADRAAFEHHLSSCAGCRGAVATLAVLPGLLRRLDPATAVSVSADRSAPPTLLPRTLAAAAATRRRERRRRRLVAVGAGIVAACLAAVVGLAVHMIDSGGRSKPPLTAMQPVAAKAPVSAEMGLVRVEGGTRVDMTCRYATGQSGQWTVRLVVYPRSGAQPEQIGTWSARSGVEIEVEALTHLAPDEIARVELHRADDTALLTWTPG
jgi:predicted anti-sigma-YlaC factor YlaD